MSEQVSDVHHWRGRASRRAGRLGGLALIAAGTASVVLSAVAGFDSPSLASGSISVSPATNVSAGMVVSVTGSGFAASSAGGVIECNDTSPQPTVSVVNNKVPVSCTNPFDKLITTTSGGAIPTGTTFSIVGGTEALPATIGPPASGTDSAGNPASSDAANYPCPPTAAQQAAGATCVIAFGDFAGDQATAQILFAGESAPTTTTTTTISGSTTTTTSGATTTTTADPITTSAPLVSTTTAPSPSTTAAAGACGGATATGSAGASLTVNPANCLSNGEQVEISGSNLAISSPGGISECSTAAGQPTMSVSGLTWGVGCSPPLSVASGPNGSFDPAFTVRDGVVGPPAAGTDTSGGSSATDAAAYPCPPTPAQQAAGARCEITFKDAAGDDLSVLVAFSQASTQPGASAGAAPTLAFTGPPKFAWLLGAAGLVMIWFGAMALTALHQSRKRLRRALVSSYGRRERDD